MLPFELQDPASVAKAVAERVRRQRIDRGWTQEEIAGRAGIAVDTYRRFEQEGKISFERLLKIAAVLDSKGDFNALFKRPEARSISELEGRQEIAGRKRVRKND